MKLARAFATSVGLLLALSCSEPTDLEVIVDLKTDYVGRAEVSSVRVTLFDADGVEVLRDAETAIVKENVTDGVRIGELGGLSPGAYRLEVQLLGTVSVPERVVRFEMEDSYAVTVVVTRDCADVVCPTEDATNLTECLGGVCVDPTCTPETPESCPTAECSSDGECADPAIGCTAAACVGGVCTVSASSDTCVPGEYCEPTMGCITQTCAEHDDCGRCARCGAGGVCEGVTFVSVVTGHQTICAIDELGDRWCWGNDPGGVLALGGGRGGHQIIPRVAIDGGDWSQIAVGYSHSAGSGLRNDGSYWMWGGDDQSPVQIGTDTNWTQIWLANSNRLALKSDNTLWRGGTQVGTDADWARGAPGWNHLCAVKLDGRLFCWGENESGQLGTGDTEPRSEPTQIGADTDWLSASGGESTSCGLKTDGRLFCWGQGYELTPTQVGTDSTWDTFLYKWHHGCGIGVDGEIRCLGGNADGELGTGDQEGSATPRSITMAGPWTSLAVGGHFTCAYHETNLRWYCWGAEFAMTTGTRESAPAPLCPGP